eukprot:SM000077S21563  [mRNA]  locus=s77:208509:209981:- [translate_table: standard]
MVKLQLQGARKMTCQVLGVVLEEATPEELQLSATVVGSSVEVLKEIGRVCDLYLLVRVLDNDSEERARSALEAGGLFESNYVNRDKVLFCSTEVGITSFVRQLEPEWHVDSSGETVSQLARFVRYELHIAGPGGAVTAPNVVSASSLSRYFGLT